MGHPRLPAGSSVGNPLGAWYSAWRPRGIPRESLRERETIGVMHYYAAMRIYLVPLSYTLMSLYDCVEVQSCVNPDQTSLVPDPRRYLLFLIEKLLILPVGMLRNLICSDIAKFLLTYVFPELPGDYEDEEDESEEHFQRRV